MALKIDLPAFISSYVFTIIFGAFGFTDPRCGRKSFFHCAGGSFAHFRLRNRTGSLGDRQSHNGQYSQRNRYIGFIYRSLCGKAVSGAKSGGRFHRDSPIAILDSGNIGPDPFRAFGNDSFSQGVAQTHIFFSVSLAAYGVSRGDGTYYALYPDDHGNAPDIGKNMDAHLDFHSGNSFESRAQYSFYECIRN